MAWERYQSHVIARIDMPIHTLKARNLEALDLQRVPLGPLRSLSLGLLNVWRKVAYVLSLVRS